MSFIPDDELKGKRTPSLAPMIDFLFLMLMFFASLERDAADIVERLAVPSRCRIALGVTDEHSLLLEIQDDADATGPDPGVPVLAYSHHDPCPFGGRSIDGAR